MAALALLVANDAFCLGQAGDHAWLLAGGIIYPVIGHLLFGRIDVRRRRGYVLFLADGMFVGAIIAAIQTILLPSLVLIIINLFNWMVIGGAALVALGILSLVAGMLAMGLNPFTVELTSAGGCLISNWVASLIAVGYFLVVARIIHRLIGEMRLNQVRFQARSDSANSAQTMAEQALLATLPESAAEKMAVAGRLEPEYIENTTVLLLDFRMPDNGLPTLETMKDMLFVCDAILTRHGVELVKTLGNRGLAITRNPSGPDDIVKAFLEIKTYFTDHGKNFLRLRGILHHGPATLGLVQSERMNLDLFGPAPEELARLDHSPSMQCPGLFVSPSLYRILCDRSPFSPYPAEDTSPACYKHSA